MTVSFVGRQKELALLNDFAHFTGLAPERGITSQTQRNEFARKLGNYFHLPGLKANDWADLFTVLAGQCQKKDTVILFDEITWMAMDDPTFLGKLKNAWDREFKLNLCTRQKRPEVINDSIVN